LIHINEVVSLKSLQIFSYSSVGLLCPRHQTTPRSRNSAGGSVRFKGQLCVHHCRTKDWVSNSSELYSSQLPCWTGTLLWSKGYSSESNNLQKSKEI